MDLFDFISHGGYNVFLIQACFFHDLYEFDKLSGTEGIEVRSKAPDEGIVEVHSFPIEIDIDVEDIVEIVLAHLTTFNISALRPMIGEQDLRY